MENLIQTLKGNPYPGRGIVIGRAGAGHIRILYFIMGRSANSRNRIFTFTGDGIRTEAYDASRLTDPSLIIYHPVRFYNGKIIVTNGDQTDTIRDHLIEGKSFRQALDTRQYEPDAPNFTPRISGIVNEDGSFELSILKYAGEDAGCERLYWRYADIPEDTARFISTYKHDGDPLPSFDTEPREVIMPQGDELWAALDRDNKVSLYVCDITEHSKCEREMRQKIYNINNGDR